MGLDQGGLPHIMSAFEIKPSSRYLCMAYGILVLVTLPMVSSVGDVRWKLYRSLTIVDSR